jgi:hypothetical protein
VPSVHQKSVTHALALSNFWPTIPCSAARWSFNTAPAASPTASARPAKSTPALYLYTRSGDQRVRIYIPPALDEAARAAIETGRQIDQLIDQVSEHNLQALLEQKQEIFTRKGRSQAEGHSP